MNKPELYEHEGQWYQAVEPQPERYERGMVVRSGSGRIENCYLSANYLCHSDLIVLEPVPPLPPLAEGKSVEERARVPKTGDTFWIADDIGRWVSSSFDSDVDKSLFSGRRWIKRKVAPVAEAVDLGEREIHAIEFFREKSDPTTFTTKVFDVASHVAEVCANRDWRIKTLEVELDQEKGHSKTYIAEIEKMSEEAIEMEASHTLFRRCYERAAAEWHKQHPERELTSPDSTKAFVALLEGLDVEIERLTTALQYWKDTAKAWEPAAAEKDAEIAALKVQVEDLTEVERGFAEDQRDLRAQIAALTAERDGLKKQMADVRGALRTLFHLDDYQCEQLWKLADALAGEGKP